MFGIHVTQTGRHIGRSCDQLAVHAGVPDIAGQKRSFAPAVGLRDKFAQIGIAVQDMTIGVDDVDVGQIDSGHGTSRTCGDRVRRFDS